MYPSQTAASLKKKHAQLLHEVSVWTIQYLLQKDPNNFEMLRGHAPWRIL